MVGGGSGWCLGAVIIQHGGDEERGTMCSMTKEPPVMNVHLFPLGERKKVSQVDFVVRYPSC